MPAQGLLPIAYDYESSIEIFILSRLFVLSQPSITYPLVPAISGGFLRANQSRIKFSLSRFKNVSVTVE